MTQQTKRAFFSLIIWGIVTAAFIPLFFSGGGPAAYVQDKLKLALMAVLFGTGYISFFIMMYLTGNRGSKGTIVKDERDEYIRRRSSGTALILVLAYVFFLCITLYEIYRESECVPVGWMWFLGYTSIFLGYITHSAAALIIHSRISGHGES